MTHACRTATAREANPMDNAFLKGIHSIHSHRPFLNPQTTYTSHVQKGLHIVLDVPNLGHIQQDTLSEMPLNTYIQTHCSGCPKTPATWETVSVVQCTNGCQYLSS